MDLKSVHCSNIDVATRARSAGVERPVATCASIKSIYITLPVNQVGGVLNEHKINTVVMTEALVGPVWHPRVACVHFTININKPNARMRSCACVRMRGCAPGENCAAVV